MTITSPDTRPLISLPTWMPGSLRAVGASRSLWYALWSSIALSYLPVLNEIIDFSNNDSSSWTGQDDAELDFLSYWTPTLAPLRQTLNGLETDAQRLERLLTLRTLLPVPGKETAHIMGWGLTAALGRATRSFVTPSTLPSNAFVPRLEERTTVVIDLDSSEAGTLAYRTFLGDVSLMVASQSFWKRSPLSGVLPVRYSPWGRANAMPLLDSLLYPKGNGQTANAIKDILDRKTLSYSFSSRQYDQTIRPGLESPSLSLEVLTATNRVLVSTPIVSREQGNALRVPGGQIPSLRWRQLAPSLLSPSWKMYASQDSSAIAPPFDLDTALSQPAPVFYPEYGSGTIPSGLAEDHPLQTDYA